MSLRASTLRSAVACLVVAGVLPTFVAAYAPRQKSSTEPPVPGGELKILSPAGQAAGLCPLKHTDVQADIAGFVARTRVRQIFHNPSDQKIEAVYVFPLPQHAAVDDMVMMVGDRRVVGQIRRREEAREVYEAARAAGHVAGLLDQERPNIFTQSVANIEPGVQVTIEISYVETLRFEDGVFEWVFPMVVGPRYIPGDGSAPAPMTTGQDTPQVPDGSKITPPVTPKGTRAGHDISLSVHLDAGMALSEVASVLHEVDVERESESAAAVSLKQTQEIPNRDFILRYRLGADDIEDAFLTHTDERGSFFTLILQPPRRIVPRQLVPRELIFVLDTSGSMNGFPIEKAKETMSRLIASMHPFDAFNVITFAGDTRILWEAPRPNTPQNREAAQAFLAAQRGAGGTEMMKAIHAALVDPAAAEIGVDPLRVVCFMTDGYVGNDMEILDAVKQNAGTTRVFAFGIGNSVNRFLLDGMAVAGRGEVEYVTLAQQADAAVERFHERVLAPVLTDITIDWGAAPVADVVPDGIPDLFSAKPVVVCGRLTGPPQGTITLRGWTGDGAYERQIELAPPAKAAPHSALASLWARTRIADLMMQDYAGLQRNTPGEGLKEQITALGLEFRLMTQFTSFVAVEELTVTVGGEPTKVLVPVEMPEGVSYEGVFGEGAANMPKADASARARLRAAAPARVAEKAPTGERAARPRPALAKPVIEEEAGRAADPVQSAVAKLDDTLRDLATKVEKAGQAGTLTVGKIKVIDWQVDVVITLRDTSPETLEALSKLGFKPKAESRTVNLVIGAIDVRKLAELTTLQAVVRVVPAAR